MLNLGVKTCNKSIICFQLNDVDWIHELGSSRRQVIAKQRKHSDSSRLFQLFDVLMTTKMDTAEVTPVWENSPFGTIQKYAETLTYHGKT